MGLKEECVWLTMGMKNKNKKEIEGERTLIRSQKAQSKDLGEFQGASDKISGAWQEEAELAGLTSL